MKKFLTLIAVIIAMAVACEKEQNIPTSDPDPVPADDSTHVEPKADTVETTGIKLDQSRAMLILGDSLILKATVTPANATVKDVIWTSFKPEIATVDSGTVVGHACGSVIIMAKTADGKHFASCLVKVTKGEYSGLNKHYDVYVQGTDGRWKSVKVTDALCSDAQKHGSIWNDWNNGKKLRDTMAYCIFEHEFQGPVKVRVRKNNGGFSRVEVRPTAYAITVSDIGDNTVEFTLPSADFRKVSVEFDRDRQHNLFLFGYLPDPDKPDPSASNVKYFGPGEHDAGKINLKDNETLYIDYGAVVYGTVEVSGSDVTIAGHGVLCGSRSPHTGTNYSTGSMLIRVNDSARNTAVRRFRIQGVTLVDAPSWTLCLYNSTDYTIEDVNIICWILNGDGIDVVSCQRGLIKNCFIRSYDDCITLKMNGAYYPVHNVSDLEICNTILYNDLARGIVVGPECGSSSYGTGAIYNINVHDCHFLQNKNSTDTNSDIRTCFAIYQKYGPNWSGTSKSTARDVYGITAKNLYFDNIASTGRNIVIYQDDYMVNTCKLYDVSFENIQVMDYYGNSNAIFLIQTNKHSIENLTIKDYFYEGQKVVQNDNKILVVKGNVTPIIE